MIIVGTIAFLVLLTACEDFLYQEPRLSQTTELTLSTYDGLTAGVVGAYGILYDTWWYGRDFVVYADLKGGNAKIGPISSGRYVTEYLWNNTPNATAWLWQDAYSAIARVNNVLEAIEEGIDEPGVEQEDLDMLAAEAKFLRGLAYFDLARIFCQPITQGAGASQLGVPIVLRTENAEPARNTLGEVYDQVVQDLLDAEAGLPLDPMHGGTDPKAWATKYAAEALLARVYLYMGQWQNAADYATKVISSGEFPVYTAAEYTTWDNGGVWGIDAASEVIFEVYGAEGNSSHNNWDGLAYISNPNGYGDVAASRDVYDLYEDTDVRKGLFRNHPPDYVDALWYLKYPGKASVDGSIRVENIPVLRVSEMYLIRAEALLNGASVSGATPLADVNMIRNNRGATPLGSIAIADVYRERRMELCFEGHQMFDLARTGRSLTRTDFDGAVNKDIPFPDYRWAFPIPQQEMDANENMEQNPGY